MMIRSQRAELYLRQVWLPQSAELRYHKGGSSGALPSLAGVASLIG